MKHESLPKALRDQVDAKLGRPATKGEGAKRSRPKPKGAALGGGVLVCECGLRFEKGWSVALVKHSNECGHRRFEVPLGELD